MTAFNISFKEFKNIAKSAAAVTTYTMLDVTMVDVSDSGVVFETVGIGTDQNLWRVSKTANSIDGRGRFFMPTESIELICKLKLNAKQDTLHFVSNGDTFTVYTISGKKIDMAAAQIKDYDECFGAMPKLDKYYARFGMKDFTTMCDNMMDFVSTERNNVVMEGMYFDWKNSRVVALDGHKILLRNIEDNMNGADGAEGAIFNLVTNYRVLKSISAMTGKVSVFTDKKYVYLFNDTFVLRTKTIDAVYFNVDQIMDIDYTWSARVDRKQMLNIADYDYSVVKNLKAPMVFDIAGGKVTARSDKARVQDQIYTDHVSGEWEEFGLNAQYVKDTMSILSDDIITIHGVNHKAPFFFSDGETYSILLLPVISRKRRHK